MRSRKHWAAVALLATLVGPLSGPLEVHGRGPGCCQGGGGGMKGNPEHASDMATFHFLLDHRAEIRRTVTPLPNGIETVTESDNPTIVVKLQEHVQAMHRRLQERRPVHRRDPLFAELFRHGDKIDLTMEKTDKGG